MREIKVRCWNEKNKKWDYFNFRNILYYAKELSEHLLNGDEFYQFTGLKDKNDKEIWEGDIVKFNVRSKTYIKYIAWMEHFAGFWIVGELDRLHDPIHWKIEVIGNIYENPELLG